MDCSPPASLVHGILQAEYWSGLSFSSPENLPDPGIEPGLPHCRQILYHLIYQGSPVKHPQPQFTGQLSITLA